ncbi:uncharacterized protein [Haliotis asinina]|uniref:uncharacterized protein isoform X2 n=1 Tax=Haliotis asinina TaxID=109174 RepID=UPI00353242E8
MDARRNRLIRIREVMDSEEEEEEEKDEGIGEELEEEVKVIQVYDPFRGLTAPERELLERRPIIAPDGHIPNSVIRKVLGQGRAMEQRTPSPWKPKPVPRADPRHLPPGWEERLRAYEEEMEEDNQGSVSSVESRKPFLWGEDDDEDEDGELKSSPSPTFTSSPVLSLTSHATKLHTKSAAADSYIHTYKPTSHGITKVDWNFDKRQDREKSEKLSTKVAPEVLAAPAVVKQKTFHRQVSQVEKIQAPTKPGDTSKKEDTPKRKTRKSMAGVDMDLLQHLLSEDWFPSDTPLEVSAAVQKLLEMLSSFGKTPAVHHKICDYIVSLQEQTGMIKPTVKQFQECLLDQLTCEMNEIRSNCVRTLRGLGMDSNNIITAILPKLVDPSRDVRQEAVLALVELTNVKDKESLADLLNKLGITRPLLSSEDEDNALKILKDKIGLSKQQSVTVMESFHDWVSDWVSSSIPGVFEGEEYIPVIAGEEEAGTAKRVKIVSPDSEGRDSSLERKRRNSTSSQRRKSFSKRRPSRSVKPGGKSSSVLEEMKPEVTEEPTQTTPKSRQGREPTKVSEQLSGGRGQHCARSPQSYVRNTPEPEAYSHDQKPWFRPKGGSGHPYPEPLTEGSGRSHDPTDSGRATHRGEGHSGKRDSGQVLSKRLIEYARMSSDKDSDLHSMSMSAGSDHQDVVIPTDISQQTEVHSQEGLSFYDSGIGRDISDSSSQGNHIGPVASYKKKVNQRQLSPVKSSSNGPSPPPKKGKDWKEFFETPSAVERRRMGMVKKDFEEGNMKKMSSLPPISYISSDLPTSPGEAGLRLLHTVRVAEKDKSDFEKHKVEAVPGRLSVHTQNVDSGRSNFGVLQMQWTTNVPVVPVSGGRQRRKKSSHMTRSYNPDLTLPPLDKTGNIHHKPHLSYMDETRFPMVQSAVESDYVWEKPLPPPPITKSRTVISPVRKIAHDHMCRHYKLAKKKLHHYISSKSPRQFPYEAQRSSLHDLHLPSLNKSKYVRHATLPPLQLGMLMDCIKVDA